MLASRERGISRTRETTGGSNVEAQRGGTDFIRESQERYLPGPRYFEHIWQEYERKGKFAAPGSVVQLTHSLQQEQKRREAAKENRASRLPKNVLIDNLLELFQYYKYWGLRELKQKTNQPDAYLREVLNEIATMWKSGDLNGKWELKPEFKERDAVTNYAEGMAPEAADSDADLGEDDDENETFEDV
jgi:TFIIF, beta subunit HTH domain